MFQWLLFLHIACVAFWLGSIAAVFILGRKAARATEPASVALAKETTRSVVRGIVNPSALVVLLSGVGMMIQGGYIGSSKQTWLAVMEMGGGTLIMLSVALLSWQLRKLTRSSDEDPKASLARLNKSMAGIGAGVLAIILIVALRIQ